MSGVPNKPYVRLSGEQWAEVRRRYERGATNLALAKIFQIAEQTVSYQAKKGGWIKKPRNGQKRGAARSQVSPFLTDSTPPEPMSDPKSCKIPQKPEKESEIADICHTNETNVSNLPAEIPEIPPETLQQLIDAPPAEFQDAFRKYAQALITQGLNQIQPPRNIGELKSFVEIWRKFSGLDVKTNDQGGRTMFAPIRSITRKPSQATVEIEQVADSATVGTGDALGGSMPDLVDDGFEI